MKLNEVSVFLISIALAYILIAIYMLSTGRPVMALLCLFLVVLCVMIIKVGSVDDEHNR